MMFMFFRRVRAVFLICVAVCLSGCNVDNVDVNDTEQITISETTMVTLKTQPPTETTTMTETESTILTESEESTPEQNFLSEREKYNYSYEPFVYPVNPVASADELLNLVFAAKQRLFENGEFYGNFIYSFGVVDVDFDGIPELFCQTINYMNDFCRVYSLREADFCKKLLEYTIYSEPDDSMTYMLEYDNDGKKAVVYIDQRHVHQWRNAYFSEIITGNNSFYLNKLYTVSWKGEDYIWRDDEKDSSSNLYDNDNWGGESNIKLEEYLNTLSPLDCIYEPVDYYWKNPGNPVFISEEDKNEHYNLLYDVYDQYIKQIKAKNEGD